MRSSIGYWSGSEESTNGTCGQVELHIQVHVVDWQELQAASQPGHGLACVGDGRASRYSRSQMRDSSKVELCSMRLIFIQRAPENHLLWGSTGKL